ncbi:hypothetical protein [Mesorhizobium sp. B2-2-2]|uniref:hypothetical protein n=1 Tax=Mesorhizobium sp. B2-2-2 TaxID=2589964 RepID=UPI0015E3D458|nr:hypothetical protein [Mesorhizobium sp. B2-2-2]
MTDRQISALLAVYVIGGVVLSYCFGDAIFEIGGEGLSVAAGLTYFGLLAFVIDKWA